MFLAYSHSLKNFKTVPVPGKKTRHPFKDAQELNPAIKGGVFPSPSQKTAFCVPNSCASAHLPHNQPAAPCAKGYHLVRTRPQLDLPKGSISARFSVGCSTTFPQSLVDRPTFVILWLPWRAIESDGVPRRKRSFFVAFYEDPWISFTAIVFHR